VDKVLNETHKQMISLGLDPIHLPATSFKVNPNCSIATENGLLKGLSNIQRVGDVAVDAGPISSRFRSSFAVTNVSADEDVHVITKDVNYTEGHVHISVDNVTVFQVFRLDYLTQMITLDQFELSVGNMDVEVTGLGDRTKNDGALITQIISKTKGPMLILINVALRSAVNAALVAAKAALFAAIAG
jgi:hypothetical protein